jgi:hypothetical protein
MGIKPENLSAYKAYYDSVNTFGKDHHEQYKFYTNLILSLSTASLAFLLTFHKFLISNHIISYWLVISALLLQFFSATSGVLVQHLIKDRYLTVVNKNLKKANDIRNSASLVVVDLNDFVHTPSSYEKFFYRTLLFCFGLSYALLLISLFWYPIYD